MPGECRASEVSKQGAALMLLELAVPAPSVVFSGWKCISGCLEAFRTTASSTPQQPYLWEQRSISGGPSLPARDAWGRRVEPCRELLLGVGRRQGPAAVITSQATLPPPGSPSAPTAAPRRGEVSRQGAASQEAARPQEIPCCTLAIQPWLHRRYMSALRASCLLTAAGTLPARTRHAVSCLQARTRGKQTAEQGRNVNRDSSGQWQEEEEWVQHAGRLAGLCPVCGCSCLLTTRGAGCRRRVASARERPCPRTPRQGACVFVALSERSWGLAAAN